MQHYERNYATARSVFTLLEVVGWVVVGIGAIASLVGFVTGGLLGMGDGNPPFGLRLLAMIPGIGMALGGLISVAFVQSSRANVDTAEMSREMLYLMKSANGRAETASGVPIGTEPASAQPTPTSYIQTPREPLFKRLPDSQ